MTDRERVADLVATAHPIIESLEATGRDSAARIMAALCEALERADAAVAAMPTWRRIPDEVVEGVAPFDGRVWDLLAASKPPSRYIDMRWHSRNRRFECVDNNMHWIEADEITHYAPIPPIPAPPAGEVG